MSTQFSAGESLQWSHRESNGMLSIRPVRFHRADNGSSATVEFGLLADGTGRPRLFSGVPLSELPRPGPAPRPSWVAPPLRVRAARSPATTESIAERLAAHREDLREAQQRACETHDALMRAADLADQANGLLGDAQRVLRNFAEMDRQAADALVDRLRNGSGDHNPVTEADTAWGLRDRAKRDRDAFQAAHRQLAAELVQARARNIDAINAVKTAAAAVVAAVVEQRADQLQRMEAEAGRLRAELRAALELRVEAPALGPLPVAHDIAGFISSDPQPEALPLGLEQRQAIIGQRQQPYDELLDRLVGGDADADLEA